MKFKSKNTYEILEMSVSEALVFFRHIPSVLNKLKTLDAVGLGYIKLGQAATTLSGGEAQKIKLSLELSKRSTGKTFYILDEPTTGLHFANFKKLIEVLQMLVDNGNTVVLMDNLNTHNPGALYEAFNPEKAKKLWDRFEFVYTPKHRSWLNMAEIELNVLNGQCLNRRIDDISLVKSEVEAWQNHRNNKDARISWQFTIEKA